MDTIEHSQRETEGNIHSINNNLGDIVTRHTATDARVQQNEDKIKGGAQAVRDLTTRVSSLPTTDDLATVRRDFNEKVCCCIIVFLAIHLRSFEDS